MVIVPIKQKDARAFVKKHHRHFPTPPVGSIFQIGLEDNGVLVGVIMVGRPVSRNLDNGFNLEINRTCILEGYKNGCSMLLGAACKAGKALGYHNMITYTLEFESGRSLHAAGFIKDSMRVTGYWNRHKPIEQESLFQKYNKVRWIRVLNANSKGLISL